MVQQRPRSRQVHTGRIHLWSHSTADSGIYSWILSSSLHSQKQNHWRSSTQSSTTSTDWIMLSKDIRPWKTSCNRKRPDHPPALIRPGVGKGARGRALPLPDVARPSESPQPRSGSGHRAPERFHACGPQVRIRYAAGTTPISPRPCMCVAGFLPGNQRLKPSDHSKSCRREQGSSHHNESDGLNLLKGAG